MFINSFSIILLTLINIVFTGLLYQHSLTIHPVGNISLSGIIAGATSRVCTNKKAVKKTNHPSHKTPSRDIGSHMSSTLKPKTLGSAPPASPHTPLRYSTQVI
jgi:hypothetical protein